MDEKNTLCEYTSHSSMFYTLVIFYGLIYSQTSKQSLT